MENGEALPNAAASGRGTGELRFRFGENWQDFVVLVDDERITAAEKDLQAMLGRKNFNGLRFLDAGSGSGLASLAARRLGARVVSFDLDPDSVSSTMYLRRTHFGDEDGEWVVESGSVLDDEYLSSLGTFDIVHSWGVLHHTGAMWLACENIRRCVAPGGTLFISLYNDQGAWSARWKRIKRLYCSSTAGRLLVTGVCAPAIFGRKFIADVVWRRNPLETSSAGRRRVACLRGTTCATGWVATRSRSRSPRRSSSSMQLAASCCPSSRQWVAVWVATSSCFAIQAVSRACNNFDWHMCGIAGFAGIEHGADAGRRILREMCNALTHRGPDEEGHLVEPDVALGMRRLSIIDLASGSQPTANEDGNVQVVFNGEIYNYRALRERLVERGHHLSTAGDTETLVHLYEDEADDLVHALRGMFAFAIWDSSRQRLLIARDRLGIKPLYYWRRDGGIAFASELRSLLSLPDFRPVISPQALASYLSFGYVREPLSIFRDVFKLPPGHRLTWSHRDGLNVERYWSPVRPENEALDEATAIRELRHRIMDAVECHLESDVPVGVFLSGGIDSSTVAAAVRHLGRTPRTFSIGFSERAYNEAPEAALVARHLRTEHTEFIIRDCPDILSEVICSFDEPFADSSAIPTLLVSLLARQHVKVVLSGDGGDELFGGYRRYQQAAAQSGVPSRSLQNMISRIGRGLPLGSPGRNRLLDLSRSRRGRYVAQVAKPLLVEEGGVARPELAALGGAFEELLDAEFEAASGREFLSQLMLVDLATYLPGDILTKIDRASMAASLEARVPLLDHELVEFAVSVPAALKIRDGQGKWLLRQAVRDLLPSHVFRKRKQGFAAPMDSWFRGQLRDGFASVRTDEAGLEDCIDWNAVERLYREHQSGRRDHSSVLWRLFVLAEWLRALGDGRLRGAPRLDLASAVLKTHVTV
jgi:asparagine synthase (glutamine-hydrolysing)